jgi:hypothetical protein
VIGFVSQFLQSASAAAGLPRSVGLQAEVANRERGELPVIIGLPFR